MKWSTTESWIKRIVERNHVWIKKIVPLNYQGHSDLPSVLLYPPDAKNWFTYLHSQWCTDFDWIMDTRRMGCSDDASRCIITQRQCLFKRRNWKRASFNCMFKNMLTAIVLNTSPQICTILFIYASQQKHCILLGVEREGESWWVLQWNVLPRLNEAIEYISHTYWSLFHIEHHDCDHCIWCIHNEEYW